jgi:hypothetical protein
MAFETKRVEQEPLTPKPSEHVVRRQHRSGVKTGLRAGNGAVLVADFDGNVVRRMTQ